MQWRAHHLQRARHRWQLPSAAETQQHHGHQRRVFVRRQAQVRHGRAGTGCTAAASRRRAWQGGQAGTSRCLGVSWVGLGGARNGLQHGHALQHGAHFFQRGGCAQAIARSHRWCRPPFCRHPAPAHRSGKHMAAVHAAQHLAHGGFLNWPSPKAMAWSVRLRASRMEPTRGPRQQAQAPGGRRARLRLAAPAPGAPAPSRAPWGAG
jgi:hypothetical protein